jgi:hypothetical protein
MVDAQSTVDAILSTTVEAILVTTVVGACAGNAEHSTASCPRMVDHSEVFGPVTQEELIIGCHVRQHLAHHTQFAT